MDLQISKRVEKTQLGNHRMNRRGKTKKAECLFAKDNKNSKTAMISSVICEINVIHVCAYRATSVLFRESECVAVRHVRFKWQGREALSKTTFGSSGRTV